VRAPGVVTVGLTSQLQPDIAVYAAVPTFAGLWEDLPMPALVVEIASPSTRGLDRHRKRPAYLAAGVQEVWTVLADEGTVERWVAASELPIAERDRLVWRAPRGAGLDVSVRYVVTGDGA
jgi:Uma2 family endonuclease